MEFNSIHITNLCSKNIVRKQPSTCFPAAPLCQPECQACAALGRPTDRLISQPHRAASHSNRDEWRRQIEPRPAAPNSMMLRLCTYGIRYVYYVGRLNLLNTFRFSLAHRVLAFPTAIPFIIPKIVHYLIIDSRRSFSIGLIRFPMLLNIFLSNFASFLRSLLFSLPFYLGRAHFFFGPSLHSSFLLSRCRSDNITFAKPNCSSIAFVLHVCCRVRI